MKELVIHNGKIVEYYYPLGRNPRELAFSVRKAADLLTQGKVAVVTTEFPTHEVTEYLLKPRDRNNS